MKVIPAPASTIPVFSSVLTKSVTIPQKTLMTSVEPKKTPREEYWKISVIVLKDALGIKSQSLGREDGKNDSLAARLARQKESTIGGKYQVFLLGLD